MGCLKRKILKNMETIFLNYLKFYNVKQEMNLEKVKTRLSAQTVDFFLMNDCFI